MLSDTLSEGLAAYGIGEKVRALRLKKKMGLVELGKHTGLSPAMLSKIERGRLFPTLPTLLRVALVFSVGLEWFFRTDPERRRIAIVRREERRRFPDRPGAKDVAYWFESLDFAATERRFNAYLAELETTDEDQVAMHSHAGDEFLYVLGGKLGLVTQGQEHVLGAGDSAYFDSTLPHGYRRVGKARCTAVVVTAP
jgi:transcriptional regulator with XRE-family HTH domain